MTVLRGLKPPVKGREKIAVSEEIERIYRNCPETTYLQACLEFADTYDYDPDVIPKLISPTLKDKIENEAINANLIKGKRPDTGSLDQWI